MKYITEVRLINFQSHKDTTIKFNEGLNIIVGQSDSGKTAILRGIRWALYNEPSGDYFIREGESECSVIITFNDGIKIKRYRSKSKNAYYLYDNDNNEFVFEGFGIKVPQEIIDKTRIEKIPLDNNLTKTINIGDQLEGPFLLSEMSSVKSNAIGRLVGVDLIDDTLKEVLRDNKKLNSDKKTFEESLDSVHIELKQYEYLDGLKEKVKKLEEIENKIETKILTLDQYSKFLSELKLISSGKLEESKKLIKLKKMDLLENKILLLENKLYKIRQLSDAFYSLRDLKENIDKNQVALRKTNSVNYISDIILSIDEKLNLYNLYETAFKKYIILKTELNKMTEIVFNYKSLDKIELIKNMIISKMDTYESLDKKYLELEGIYRSKEIGVDYLSKFSYIETINLNNIEGKVKKLEKLRILSNDYKLIVGEGFKITQNIEDINKTIESNMNNYKEVLKEFKTCPICSTNLNTKKIEEILNNYI